MIAGLVMLAAFSALPAFGSTITVTNNSDSGAGSLRNAIATAAPGDNINFSLTLPATITLASTLTISSNLTISGPGASSLFISGNNAVQVFNIGGGITVTISGLTIQNGSNSASNGGGISNSGTLMLNNSTLSGNSASNGGGISNSGTLMLNNSTLSGNSAVGPNGGGGIFNYYGTLTLTNSTLSGNSAVGPNIDGGGSFIYGGTLTVTNSTFSGNSAFAGGGIFTIFATVALTNSTLSSNSASFGGAGFYIYNGTLTAKNSIVANSPSGGNCNNNGTLISQGHNLSDDGTCSTFFNQTGDVNSNPVGLDPSGLKSNGGPTQTIALLATSPAVDAIPLTPTNYCTDVNGAPVTTDQRSFARPAGPACDIGAFELGADDDTGLAQLNGSNTLTGNQTVNGNLTATNFVGNGAGLTGVNAATANTANFATSAGTAATATNALSLGSVPAGNYARLDIGNIFGARQTINNDLGVNGIVHALSVDVGVGGVVINPGNLFTFGTLNTLGPLQIGSSGTRIIQHLSQTLSLGVPVIGPATCAPLTSFNLIGASDGDSLALGVPNSLLNPVLTGAGILNYSAWVSATNTITIRVCNLNPNGPKSTAVSGTIRVDVWKH